MWPLPVDDLYMVGKHSAQRLHGIGIHTIGELAEADEKELVKTFNKQGSMMWNYANGRGDNSLTTHEDKNRCISTSETFSTDIGEKNKLLQILYRQTDSLCKELRKKKLYTNTIAITYKNADFISYSKQMTIFTVTNSTEEICKYIDNLLEQSWNNDPLRNIGIRFSNLTAKKQKQISIFNDDTLEEQNTIVQNTIDQINDKYKTSVIRQANLFIK